MSKILRYINPLTILLMITSAWSLNLVFGYGEPSVKGWQYIGAAILIGIICVPALIINIIINIVAKQKGWNNKILLIVQSIATIGIIAALVSFWLLLCSL